MKRKDQILSVLSITIITTMTTMTIAIMAAMMTMMTMRKLEVVHKQFGAYMRKLEALNKEVGGCLIWYNLQLACVRQLEVIWPDARTLPHRSLWIIIINEWLSPIWRYSAALAAKNGRYANSPRFLKAKSMLALLYENLDIVVWWFRSLDHPRAE